MRNGFRLSLTTNKPITTTDVVGATTIYMTPYMSGNISLYNGSEWIIRNSNEVSLALGTLVSGRQYDIFAYWTGSAVRIELGPAWFDYSDHSGTLARQDGVIIKTGDASRRYLGTLRTTSTTQTEDSTSKRFLWNYYNQVKRHLSVIDNTNTWTYASPNGSWRQVRGASTNAFELVQGGSFDVGDYGSPLTVMATGLVFASAAAVGNMAAVGIGVNITSFLQSTVKVYGCNPNSTSLFMTCTAEYQGNPSDGFGEGHHTINWLETGVGAVTYTFAGDNGTTVAQTGMVGWMMG